MTRAHPRELSPRALARLLAPAWRIDRPVLDGAWTLDDVHATGRRGVIVLELRRGDAALSIGVEVDAGAPPEHCAGGLSTSWLAPGPADAGHAACLEVARILRAKLGAAPHAWAVPEAAERLVPAELAAEVGAAPARLDDDPDAALLAADAASYRRLFGCAPHPVRLTVAGEAAPGISMCYPAPINGEHPPTGRLYPVPPRFFRRRFRHWLGQLGCRYDDGVPRTVPTPTTFAAAARARLGHPPPLTPHLERGGRASIAAGRWVARVTRESVLPVAVAPGWAVTLHRAIRTVERLSHIPVDVGMLAHDVSLHAIGLHAVPRECWEALTAIAREKPADSVAAVASFFEGDVTRTAWEVWNDLDAPERFGEAFTARCGALEAALREM